MTGATLVVVLFSFTSHAAMLWAPAPAKHGHGGHDRHAAKLFKLIDGQGASVQLINPQLKSMEMAIEQGVVKVKSTGMDNYHALVATRSGNGVNESAIRYVYQFGKPSGESPSNIMGLEKSKLEIEPSPYAREHWRYQSGTEARFILRFDGKPLANMEVEFTTSNGSEKKVKTDLAGRFVVDLPRDFAEVNAGRMANHPAELILTAGHSVAGERHLTTFSADYHVNPDNWQSTQLGIAAVAGGSLLAGIILLALRRRENR
ncbi:hypothetical protein ACFL48_00385 [Pseudomonadota bacterium]